MKTLADSHVHLDWYAEPESLVARARQAEVGILLSVSVDLESSRRTVAIAHRCQGVVAAVGFHPVHLPGDVRPGHIAELEAIARDPSVGCVGEIGLDSVDAALPLGSQVVWLREQLALASRLALPVNLHLRGDQDVAYQLLANDGVPSGGIVHYFVGSLPQAWKFISLGLLISVGKPVTRPANSALRQVVSEIPLESLLLETDSYPLPGRTTEPKDVVLVADVIATLRGTTRDDVANTTTENLRRLLPPRAVAWSERHHE